MTKLQGRLFLLPAPIVEESLEAISPEAIRIIHELDYFIVEKARTARRFISATRPLKSIDSLKIEEMGHGGNTPEEIEKMLMPLSEGQDVGILSEAGLPGIADPGNLFVRVAHQSGIRVIPVAGPSSIVMALIASGLEGQRFSFHGYLSAKKDILSGQLKDLERRADRDDATQIWIETPYRNVQMLEAVGKQLDVQRMFCIAAGLGSENGYVMTKKMMDWKKLTWPEIHKVPAVFLIR